MHTRAPCQGRQAAVVVSAAAVAVPVVVAAAVVAAAGLAGVAGTVEDSAPAGIVAVALGRCPGASVFARRVPKGLSRADLSQAFEDKRARGFL